jgi:hypothetical protein
VTVNAQANRRSPIVWLILPAITLAYPPLTPGSASYFLGLGHVS